MVKQLSSLDINFIMNELLILENARVDKIYNIGKEELVFQFFKTNQGKKLLRVRIGKAIFLGTEKSPDDKPSEFCMLLRKHLNGKTLDSIRQLKPERIIEMTFTSKDEIKKLYLEFFAKGNAIICTKDDIILDALTKHKFKDRSILPKQPYTFVALLRNVFSMDTDTLTEVLKTADKESLIKTLALDLGIGGVYAEELCLQSGVLKDISPTEVSEKQIGELLEKLTACINQDLNPHIVYIKEKAKDVIPFSFSYYSEQTLKAFPTFSGALEHYFEHEVEKLNEKPNPYDQKIAELKRIIADQEKTIANLEVKETEFRETGELIYHQYAEIKQLLDEITELQKSHGWDSIREKLKNNKLIKEINIKDKQVVVDV